MYEPGYGDVDSALAMVGTYFTCMFLFMLLVWVLYLWLFYRIFSKAGYSGWMTLLNLIPGVGSLIVVLVLAFGDWPVRRGPQAPMYPQGGYQTPAAPAAPVAPAPAPTYVPPAPPQPAAPAPTEQPPAPPAPPVQ